MCSLFDRYALIGSGNLSKMIPSQFRPSNKTWGYYDFNTVNFSISIFIFLQVCVHGVGSLHQLAKRRELFVNKFHQDFQPLAFDCMEELLRNRTKTSASTNYKFDSDYISNLSFVVNHD
jgi:hypothetical protein